MGIGVAYRPIALTTQLELHSGNATLWFRPRPARVIALLRACLPLGNTKSIGKDIKPDLRGLRTGLSRHSLMIVCGFCILLYETRNYEGLNMIISSRVCPNGSSGGWGYIYV